MIRSQIVYSRIAAIARELAETVGRTARSPGLTEGRRYAAALLTGEPKLVAQAQYDASHVFLIRDSVAALLDRFAFNLGEGDIVLVGDPYSGGSTPQAITIAAPLFYEGELVLFPAVRAEMADLAGEFPGSLHPFASETWQEAVRFTPLKLYRHGLLQRDALRFMLRNSRAESQVRADIEAIVSALRAASDSLVALMDEKGRAATEAAIARTIEHSRALGSAQIDARYGAINRKVKTKLPVSAEATVDLSVRVTIDEGRLALDFAGTGANRSGPYNMTPGQTKGYALVAALAETLDDTTLNDGHLQLVTMTAPKGSLVDPVLPAATGLSDAVTAHHLVRLVRAALHGGTAPVEARLDGVQPAVLAFLPIGAEDNPPIRLDPGFALSAQGWGPPVLAGRRLMPSAEVLEAREHFNLVSREIGDDGRIRAVIRNDGPELEGNFLVPRDGSGPQGGLALVIDGERRALESAVLVVIPPGARIEFVYPTYAERADG
ncbi:MAG: hydantoinase B/oxoprolinase family protein [Candidatus Kaistia colombiensis]|nr:MAG: hydantoinase B/oxoprolinase family protein [Kaistia sp.]